MAELDLQQQMVEAAKERSDIAKALLAIQSSLDKMEPMVSQMEHVLASLAPAVNAGVDKAVEQPTEIAHDTAPASTPPTISAASTPIVASVLAATASASSATNSLALPATGGCFPRAHTTCSTTGLDPDTGHIQVAAVPLLMMDKFLTGPAHGELSYFGLAPSVGILSAVQPLEEAVHAPFRPLDSLDSKGRPPGPAPVPKPPWLLLGTMHMFEEKPATIVMVKRQSQDIAMGKFIRPIFSQGNAWELQHGSGYFTCGVALPIEAPILYPSVLVELQIAWLMVVQHSGGGEMFQQPLYAAFALDGSQHFPWVIAWLSGDFLSCSSLVDGQFRSVLLVPVFRLGISLQMNATSLVQHVSPGSVLHLLWNEGAPSSVTTIFLDGGHQLEDISLQPRPPWWLSSQVQQQITSRVLTLNIYPEDLGRSGTLTNMNFQSTNFGNLVQRMSCVAANICVPANKYTAAICVPAMNYRYVDANVQEKEAYYAEYNSTLVAMLDTDRMQWKISLLLSHALILEFGPCFALEIAWTIRLTPVKSWFPSCFAGCDSLYGRDNFQWTIAWSLGSHSHVPRFRTRLPCDMVQHNCPANYHGRWFRFMMGKLTSEIPVAIAYRLACAVPYQDSGGNLPYLQAVEFFHMDANSFVSDQAECCTISVLCDVRKVDTYNFQCAFFTRFNSWFTKGQPSGWLLILVPGVISRQALLLPRDPRVLICTRSTDGTRFLHIPILPEVTTRKMARLPMQQLLLPWDPGDPSRRYESSYKKYASRPYAAAATMESWRSYTVLA